MLYCGLKTKQKKLHKHKLKHNVFQTRKEGRGLRTLSAWSLGVFACRPPPLRGTCRFPPPRPISRYAPDVFYVKFFLFRFFPTILSILHKILIYLSWECVEHIIYFICLLLVQEIFFKHTSKTKQGISSLLCRLWFRIRMEPPRIQVQRPPKNLPIVKLFSN